ncbi:MAG: hypothetical protein ACE5DR_04555 [Thermodesulfobacteriota bacterium]
MTVPLIMVQGAFTEIDAIWTNKIPVNSKVDFPALRDSEIVIIEVVERNLEKLDIRKKVFLKAFAEKADN